MPLSTSIIAGDTGHVTHTNALHTFYNSYEGYTPSSFAAASHNHAASEITSGTIGTARLGSGTANSTVFLRGDQTWAAPSTTAYAKATRSVTMSGSETILSTDDVVLLDPNGANRTVDLPAIVDATTGPRWVTIKKTTADAYTLTVTPNGDNIDGAATYVITNPYESVELAHDASNWWIVG